MTRCAFKLPDDRRAIACLQGRLRRTPFVDPNPFGHVHGDLLLIGNYLRISVDAGSPFPRQERTAGRVGRNLKSGNISLGRVGEQKNDASPSECLLSERPCRYGDEQAKTRSL